MFNKIDWISEYFKELVEKLLTMIYDINVLKCLNCNLSEKKFPTKHIVKFWTIIYFAVYCFVWISEVPEDRNTNLPRQREKIYIVARHAKNSNQTT